MTASCFHCELEVPKGSDFKLMLLDQERQFCCPGCLAIARTIADNNLQDFYKFRTTTNPTPVDLLPQEISQIEALDAPAVFDSISHSSDRGSQIELGIEGITCAACGWLIKRQIEKRDDVVAIEVNVTTRRALVTLTKEASLSAVVKAINSLGYKAFPFSEDLQEIHSAAENRSYIRRIIVAGLGMMQVMMFTTGLYLGEFQDISPEHAYFLYWVSGIVATPVVLYSAFPFYQNAWRSLKFGHLGMNLPVSIAIIIGYLASVYSLLAQQHVYYFDSVVMFTFFLLIGRYIEQRMRLKAILKQQNFKRLLPLSVNRINSDGSVSPVLVETIEASDKLVINAGDTVPVDGFLVSASAEVNEAILTGEFMPVLKQKDDPVISGSSNNDHGFIMRASRNLGESRLVELIRLQDSSEQLSSVSHTLADRVAHGYISILLLITFATAIVWWQLDPYQVFPVVLSLLVVSCPCALSLATPAAVAAATANLTDRGLMINSLESFQRLAKVSDVFFDKTGTLTLGKMSLLRTRTHQELTIERCNQLAATLETPSNHPVAEAFKQLNCEPVVGVDAQEVIAQGVKGIIDGAEYRLGNAQFTRLGTAHNTVEIPENNGSTESEKGKQNDLAIPLFLTRDDQLVATFYLSDQLNPTAPAAIQALKLAGLKSVLLSGDSQIACNAIADQLTIDTQFCEATPEDKRRFIQSAQTQHKTVLMLGDGVNDIGALRQADVGITMGSASHLAHTRSDAVLVTNDLAVVPEAIGLAQKLSVIIKQNLSWAIAYNLTAIPFAVAGLVPAWLAAIGMTSSSLIVVLNALRLRKE